MRLAFSERYKRYVLWTLTIVYAWNYVDRVLMALLLQPIKGDLHLSDTQLGFLTGIAFGLFYATLGLPIARWADRGNRVTITAAAIGSWGATVMSCLLVKNFAQLLCARVATAVGEAGCMPPTYSLLGDYFPAPADRTRAMTVYTLGFAIGTLPGFLLGGWLNARYGWRMTFLLMGAPGLLFAALVGMTIREPRSPLSHAQRRKQPIPPLRGVLGTLWKQHSSRHLIIAIVLLWTIALGMAPWYAAFMMRSHGVGTAELGVWFGLIFSVPGIVGTVLGGYLASRWFANDERGQMRMSAATVALLFPCFILFLLLSNKHQAMIALVPVMMMFCIFLGPTFALMQRLVVDEMRATTLAAVMLSANLVGMGVGPQAVGVLSDLLTPVLGTNSLRYSMLTMSMLALASAYHFWQVGRTVKDDLAIVEKGGRSSARALGVQSVIAPPPMPSNE